MAEPDNASQDEPIDVEFTSADTAETEVQSKQSSGPGWVGLIVVGVFAALAGGAIGVVAGGTGGRYAQASEVALDISQLQDTDRSLQEQVTRLNDDVRSVQTLAEAANDTLETREIETEESFEALSTELAQIRQSYLALLGDAVAQEAPAEEGDAEDAPQPDATDEAGETPEPAPDATPSVPMPGITLAQVMERLESGTGGNGGAQAASPELVRNVAALQTRADQLEQADAKLQSAVQARQAAINALEKDVKALETALNQTRQSQNQLQQAAQKDRQASNEKNEQLTGDLNALRKIVNQRLSNLDEAKLSANEEAMIKRADRVLALAALETAVRAGEPYEKQLEELALKLPANSRVAGLRRLEGEEIPTTIELKNSLQTLKEDVRTAGMPDAPSGQWAWLGDLLSSVVTVREEGTAQGATASQRVDTALTLLEAGDLPGALNEVKPIDGPQGEVLADWIAAAERRVQADSLVERLRTDVMDLETAQ